MDLVTIEIMRELATMKGDRNPDGTWKSDNARTMEKYLVRAVRFQKRIEERLNNPKSKETA